MNYVAVDTVTFIDRAYTHTTRQCGSGGATAFKCLRMQNGGMVLYHASEGFCATGNNAIYIYFDPDGKVTDGTTTGPGKSVLFMLYFNGRLRTGDTVEPGTQSGQTGVCSATYNPGDFPDPPWFSWD